MIQSMQYKKIKKDINKCYLCLEDIDYYIKFNCECHNYLHTECIKNKFITDCFICKKKILFLDNVYSKELIITNYLTNKINTICHLDKLPYLILKNNNCFELILYIFLSIFFTIIIIIPCLLLDFILEKIKNIFNNFFI